MKRALALTLTLSVGCVTAGRSGRHCPPPDPLEALLAVGVGALAFALDSEPAAPRQITHVIYVRPPLPPEPRPSALDGWVIAEDGGEGVAFTVVSLTGQGVRVRVLTNAKGRFQIPPPLDAGHYALAIIDERWDGQAEVDVEDHVVPAIVVRAHPSR